MGKIYTKIVNKCTECPHMFMFKYGGIAVESFNCGAGNKGRELESLLEIPGWCPLEDEEDGL